MTTSYGRHADDDTAEIFPTVLAADPAEPAVFAAGPADHALLAAEPTEPAVLVVGLDGIDLAADPVDDDLTEQLAARAPKRYANRATVVLAGLLLLVGGFLGGVQVQKHFGKSSTQASNPFANSAAARSALGRFGAGGATGTGQNADAPGGTGQNGSSTATTGTVKLVDGTTVYIQTANGDTVTVKTGTSTSVQVNGALKDLAAGSTVTIDGQTAADGTVTATRITKTK